MLKPAEIDLRGAGTVAILPFAFPSQNQAPSLDAYQAALYRLWYYDAREAPLERNVARYIESQLSISLFNTKRFTVTKADDLRSTASQGDSTGKIGADILVSGAILTLTSAITNNSYTGSDGKYYESYENRVVLEIRYDFISTADNALIAVKSLHDQKSASGTYSAISNSTEELAKKIVAEQIPTVIRAIAPYAVTERRTLAIDETKDPQMAQADRLVRDGFYQKAFDLYTSVYAGNSNFAAGFNAAMVMEIMGDVDEAIAAMKALADASANPKALREAQRMIKTRDEAALAASQTR
ncbi:MAG: hypothetical protein CVV47_17165 [Spirochaetae bacterium HGW-Spirochaetae-3]|jgi:hypothetical protein|nr:MAG: hypothetical protein CVV47_17165 [Spirochaetae bacterium HGW-Spirochaetae-3]